MPQTPLPISESKSPSRLPIEHPDYVYPPSKNPYWKKLAQFPGLAYGDNESEMHRGQWRSLFPTPVSELRVEIGCNAGHVVVEWARQNPGIGFIGIDWKIKAIHRAAEKAQFRGLKNLIFLWAHAGRLDRIFAPGEIDFLALYFPDPWPKKAHWKHRFVTPERLRMISRLMAPNGTFHIKTDHAGYFAWMEEALAAVPDAWRTLGRSANLHADHPAPETLEIPEVTLFEKLFIQDRLPIHSLRLGKSDSP
jgi:tRNA (guanine-N7-)-methyltransferase